MASTIDSAPTVAGRPLEGKVTWVTGSSRGIGRVIAEHLADLGARVAVHGSTERSPIAYGGTQTLTQVAAAIAASSGSDVIPVTGDLTDNDIVVTAAGSVAEQLGPIDILINCAGGDIGSQGVDGPEGGKPLRNDAIDISLADVESVLDRNLMTCILCCRTVGASMRDRGTGWIVNIGSIAGLAGRENGAIYCTAKAAVHEYTRCLAAELRPHNVRVNVVAPGLTYTARFAASRPIDEDMMVEDGTLERYGRPIEMARVVSFLLTGGTYITGQVIRVDGGQQLWPA